MILEDISDYEYFYSLPLGTGSGVLNSFVATYNNTENLNFVSFYEFENLPLAEEFINNLLPLEKDVLNVNNSNLYVFNDSGAQHIAWKNGNYVVYIMNVLIDSQTEIVTPLPIISAYLDRYPSDIVVDNNESKLIINKINISWEGFSQVNVENGGNITETLRGGTPLMLSIELLNNYTLEENVTLDDVFVNVIIKNIETGYDDTLNISGEAINAQDLGNIDLIINLPNEDGRYEIIISANGDNNGIIILSEEKNFFVNVEENVEDFIELR